MLNIKGVAVNDNVENEITKSNRSLVPDSSTGSDEDVIYQEILRLPSIWLNWNSGIKVVWLKIIKIERIKKEISKMILSSFSVYYLVMQTENMTAGKNIYPTTSFSKSIFVYSHEILVKIISMIMTIRRKLKMTIMFKNLNYQTFKNEDVIEDNSE